MKKAVIVLLGIVAAVIGAALYAAQAVRANRNEESETLPGDEFIPHPIAILTHAITIRRPPHDVWPWLAQMGSDRAGWYAYDFIDNGGRPSADRILPEFQKIAVGTVFPCLPGAKDVFIVARSEPDHDLVLSWRSPAGDYFNTWTFVLEEPQPGTTRLITRGRAGPDYHPYGLPQWLLKVVAPWAHLVMERKQLLGIAQRAEGRT